MPLTAFAIAPHSALLRCALAFPRHFAPRLTALTLLTLVVIASHAGPAGAARPVTATATPAPGKTGAATVSRATTKPTIQPSIQPGTKTATQPGRSAKTTAAAKGKPATPRQQLKREAEGLALATTTVETISEAQLDVAMRVLTGAADCEFNERITVAPVAGQPGHFYLGHKGQRYTMVPEETTTGAVRLVDRRAGVVWLQIPVKSMLMNSTQGRRLVDACTHAEQRAALASALAHGEIGTGIGIAPSVTAVTVTTAATYAPAVMATVATATPAATAAITVDVATLSAAPAAAATEPPAAPAASSTAAAGPMAPPVTPGAAVATVTTGAEPITAPAPAPAPATAPAPAPAAAMPSAPAAAPAAAPASATVSAPPAAAATAPVSAMVSVPVAASAAAPPAAPPAAPL